MPFKRMNVTNLKWNDLCFNWKYSTHTHTHSPNPAEDNNDITVFDINTLCFQQFVSSSFFRSLCHVFVVLIRKPTIFEHISNNHPANMNHININSFSNENGIHVQCLMSNILGFVCTGELFISRKNIDVCIYEIVLHRPLLISSIEFSHLGESR